jgi:hypothetical protein
MNGSRMSVFHVAGLTSNAGVAAQRQVASSGMVVELEKQAATIGDTVKAVARHRGYSRTEF